MENNEIKGVRITGPLRSIVGAGGGDGAVLANQVTLHTLSTGKRCRLRKLMASNRTANAVWIWIGYGDLTGAGSVFRQTMPSIRIAAGQDLCLTEAELPAGGNTAEGFAADTTAVTGTTGDILAEASASGAAPNDVQIQAEVEEF